MSRKRRPFALGRRPARWGVATRQPVLWLTATAVMSLLGGPRGRRAAARGSVCYLLAAALVNGVKPLFHRPQPRHRKVRRPEVARGSFPSGHAAAEVAYTFGAAHELPAAFVPFAAMALLAHWSLFRSRKHYAADMLAGGSLGLVLVGAVARLWPRRPRADAGLPAGRRGSLASSS